MKLRLSVCLFKALLLSVSVCVPAAYAGAMHSDVAIQTYTDFGQNCGRYVVGAKENALLKQIRDNAGGVEIPYTVDGQDSYVITHGMINFSATYDNGAGVAISPTFIATVNHNPAYRINASYGNRTVGSDYSLKYEAIAIEGSDVFWLDADGWDYAVHRQSKLQTDAVWNPLASQDTVSGIKDKVAAGDVVHIYHSGGGIMQQYADGSYVNLSTGHTYNIGTVQKITGMTVSTDNGRTVILQDPNYDEGYGANADNPLPNGLREGDSGSPVFIYNATSGRYEYIASQQAIRNSQETITQAYGNVAWLEDTLATFDVDVNMADSRVENHTVYLNKITQTEEVITDSSNRSTTICEGTVTNAAGDALATFNGIASGQHTWKSLAPVMDSETWYTYSGYLNQTDEDLFFNDNLVFSAAANAVNNIILTDTVDLGVGYVEFNAGEYHISSELTAEGESEGNLLNSAGYVLNADAKVHIKLTNPSDYVYEWRAMGPGELYIDGTGNTHALLNLGGNSTVYLQQSGGYAAYNVLANGGATVQLTGGTGQIKRDFTFGAGGGTLDMYGHSMEWNNSTAADGRFTIHALTEEAIITNTAGTSTLAITDAGEEFYGSFKDSDTGTLKVVYQGSGTLAMHGIHTKLSNSFDVQSGAVSLSGTHTVHGLGSDTGTNANRLQNPDDWHYADATMNVSVATGGAFELGSHARLKGDVTVAAGGTFIMREGVKHDEEYVEGGTEMETVAQYADFYGLKGDVYLDGEMQIAYNEGVTAAQFYAGNISGTGSLSVDLGNSGANLTLSGNNTFTGAKELISGILIAEDVAALGDCTTEKWVVQQGGTLVLSEGISFSDVINDATGGVIALTSDRESQVALNSVIGAYEGYTVNYGDSNTALQANSAGEWHLGGGGGTLVVDFLLQGDNTLVLGDGTSCGVVKLANTNNSFSGKIKLTDGVKLDFDDKSALGNGKVYLDYTAYVNDAMLTPDLMHADSVGVYYVDSFADADLDFSTTPNLSVAAGADTTYTGTLTVSGAYRLGGGTGILTVATELSGEHDLVLDAQTRAGNKVVLAQAATLTGAVSVMGYDAAQSNGVTTGDMTLQLAVNDALAAASGVTLKAGATLDINGTTQSLKSLEVQAGAFVLDSAGAGELSVAGGTVVGSLQLGKLNVTGGTLTLSGNGAIISNLKIGTGATFDINNANKSADSIGERISHVELAGGTLANTGDNIGAGSRQFYSLTLTADSSINSAKQFGLIGSGHGVTDIKLNNHTLTKNGAGQFDIYNTSITSGKVLVQEGSLYFSDNGKVHNSTIAASVMLDGGSFNVWKSGTGSLTFSGSQTQISTLTANAGSITFEAGSHQVTSSLSINGGALSLASGATLDLSAVNIGGNAGVGMINKILNATTGAGTLKLQTSSQAAAAVLDASAAVHTNVETGALYLNSWKTQNSVVTLHEDSSLTVANELYVQSTAKLCVAGGSLSADTVTLGHGTKGNPGTLELAAGSITTKSFKQANTNDTANVFCMTGGTLEFTQNTESAIAAGIQLSISGGTLKAAESSWFVNRAVTLGNVTVDVAEGKSINLKGAVAVETGSTLKLTGAGKLWVADGVQDDAESAPNGISLAANGEGQSAEISGLADLSRDGATVYLAGTEAEHAIVANTIIDIMEGSSLNMSNVVLQDTSRITDATATFNVSNVVAQVSGNNSTIAVAEGGAGLCITSSLIDSVNITGSDFIVQLADDIELEGYKQVSITFTDGTTAATFDPAMNITLRHRENDYQVYFEEGDTSTLYAAVPEPGTATLSLLALAALAARRRRS